MPGDADRGRLGFADLDGWPDDDHGALRVDLLAHPPVGWDLPPAAGPARQWFELHFQPVLPGPGPALFTGYFEPVLDGARAPDACHAVPVYAAPDPGPLPDRAAIEAGALDGQGLEILWLSDPVEAYFLHVQGSGRVRLDDGTTLRLGYAGQNGHPYVSLGRHLVQQGHLPEGGVTADRLRDWLRAQPDGGRRAMQANPSYVFFRCNEGLSAQDGPLGTQGVPLTPLRSVAVDPAFVPLGAPVWIEAGTDPPLRRLCLAQDTGGAIKGPQRADIFFGTGPEAGLRAGRTVAGGRMVLLLPRNETR